MEEAITVLVTEFEKSRIQDRDIRRRTALGNYYMEEFKLWTQPSKHFFLSHSSVSGVVPDSAHSLGRR
jgi:hypothetical protein